MADTAKISPAEFVRRLSVVSGAPPTSSTYQWVETLIHLWLWNQASHRAIQAILDELEFSEEFLLRFVYRVGKFGMGRYDPFDRNPTVASFMEATE